MNAYEMLGRRNKADKLVAAIRRLDGTAADARAMTEEDWANAAKLAGVNIPSLTTRDLVIKILEKE